MKGKDKVDTKQMCLKAFIEPSKHSAFAKGKIKRRLATSFLFPVPR
jgi:hypothetical protein